MYKHERVVIGAIIAGGLVALLFAFPYLGKAIRDPLKLQPRTVETLDEKEAREFKELKGKDTDGDTLTDYDEIYVWNTSAYLADSDSDGYADNIEIETGNDPNCPRNADCGRALSSTDLGEKSSDATGGDLGAPTDLYPPTTQDTIFGDSAGLGGILSSLPPAEIRKFLIENGVPEESIKDLTDTQLENLYKYSVSEAMKQLEEQGEAGAEAAGAAQ